jgi:hypothetical protein
MAHRIALALVAVLLSQAATATHAQPDEPGGVPRARSFADLPLDKRYEQFTPQQRRQVKAQYDHLQPGDEPPFPAQGLGPMYRAIALVEAPSDVGRELSLDVLVDRDGKATQVDVLDAPSHEMARYASAVVRATAFKPAVCRGAPCAMSFPVRIRFERPF